MPLRVIQRPPLPTSPRHSFWKVSFNRRELIYCIIDDYCKGRDTNEPINTLIPDYSSVVTTQGLLTGKLGLSGHEPSSRKILGEGGSNKKGRLHYELIPCVRWPFCWWAVKLQAVAVHLLLDLDILDPLADSLRLS